MLKHTRSAVWLRFPDVEKCFLPCSCSCFVCRGRPVKAKQGGCHTDLWASWWNKTLQCTERTVGPLYWNLTPTVVDLACVQTRALCIYGHVLCKISSQCGTPEAYHLRLPGVSADTRAASKTWKWRCQRQHFLWLVHVYGSCVFVRAKCIAGSNIDNSNNNNNNLISLYLWQRQ